MSVLWLMIPVALLLGGGFLAAFVGAVWRGQYDDLDSPGFKMLLEEVDGPEVRNSSLRTGIENQRKVQ